MIPLLLYMVVFRFRGNVASELTCTDYPSSSGTDQERCEAGNDLNNGYAYFYNENRETETAVCGEDALCNCCRGPQGVYCTDYPSSSGTEQERCEAGNDLNNGYEYFYNENRETETAVCGEDAICNCCREPHGLYCTDFPSSSGTDQERCEAGNDLSDGYEYLYNENRGTDSAFCGKDANCNCCRRPQGLYCTDYPSSSGTDQERCEAGNDLNDGYEYLYNENRETETAVCGKDAICNCCRGPPALYCTDYPSISSSGTDQERCEIGNDLNDGYQYLYNENRETETAVCGEDATCNCCRGPPGLYCTDYTSSSGTDQERCEAGNDLNDGYEYLYNANRGTDSAVCGKDTNCWCCRKKACASSLSSGSLNNYLCDTESWSILYGEWRFDACTCSLINTLSSKSIVWFGSADGITPDDTFMNDDFILKIQFKVSFDVTNLIDSGVIIRESDDVFDRIGINATTVSVYHGDTLIESNNHKINIKNYAVYELKIVSIQSVYDVYINNKLVLEDVTAPRLTAASIGLIAEGGLVIFYSITYKEAVDTAGNIGSLSLNSDDGSVQQQSGSADATKLFCGADEDKPLWAGVLSLNQELLSKLFEFSEDDAVTKVLEYIQCSEIIYSMTSFIGALLVGPRTIIDVANLMLKKLKNIPHIAHHIEDAADEISQVIVNVLSDITPDFTTIDWDELYEPDGTIFNPFETLREVIGIMLSDKVCSTILGGNMDTFLGELKDSNNTADTITSFNDIIYNFLNGDTILFSNDLKNELLSNDFYKEFSFVLTIGMEICFAFKGAGGCVTRMHGISINLKGDSQIFESRSVYIEVPVQSDGIYTSSFTHVDFLSNYLDVISDELSLHMGLTAEVPSFVQMTQIMDIWDSHSDKMANIPFIGNDLGESVDFVNGKMDDNQLIMDILIGDFSAQLGVVLGVDVDNDQDLLNCNGFRISLSVGADISSSKFQLLFGYEYRKENGIPQNFDWSNEIETPNFQQIAKFMWGISKSGINIFGKVLDSVDDVVLGLADDIGDVADDKLIGILNSFLDVIEDIVNFFIDGINAMINIANGALDELADGFTWLIEGVDYGRNGCLDIDDNCAKLGWGMFSATVCVRDIIALDGICNALFDGITAPLDVAEAALNAIPNIPTVDKIDIRDVSAAKQPPNILNIDNYKNYDNKKEYDNNAMYSWDGYDKPLPDVTITIPTCIYTILTVEAIVIASLFMAFGYCLGMRRKHRMYAPVKVWKYGEDSTTAADTDIDI